MSAPTPLHEPSQSADLPGRQAVEEALRTAAGPVRFRKWRLLEADLSDLDLHRCEFVGCRAGSADLSRADLSEARFDGCDLNNSRWRGARLAAAEITGCKLTGAQFQEVSALGLAFHRSLLVSAHLRGHSFRKQPLEGLDFSGADLADCDFRDAAFTDCSLRDANLTNARFEGADLRGADLGPLKLNDAARFRGAVISKRQAAELLVGIGLRVV